MFQVMPLLRRGIIVMSLLLAALCTLFWTSFTVAYFFTTTVDSWKLATAHPDEKNAHSIDYTAGIELGIVIAMMTIIFLIFIYGEFLFWSLVNHLEIVASCRRCTNQYLILQKDRTCPICLEPFQTQEILRRCPKCVNDFHKECLHRWLFSQRLRYNCTPCPICRCELVYKANNPMENWLTELSAFVGFKTR